MLDRVDEYRALLDEALAIMPGVEGELRYGPDYRKVGHIAHGWYMRVHRGVVAVMALEEAGHAGEAPPLRRSIIEHVVGLDWLAAEGDKILAALEVGHKEWTDHLRTSLEGSSHFDADAFEKVAESMADADKSAAVWNKFTKRTNHFGDQRILKQYFAETGQSHATYESAMAYFDIETNDFLDTSRRIEPQAPFAPSS